MSLAWQPSSEALAFMLEMHICYETSRSALLLKRGRGWDTHSALRAGHAGGGDSTGSGQQGHSNRGEGLHCAGGEVFRKM